MKHNMGESTHQGYMNRINNMNACINSNNKYNMDLCPSGHYNLIIVYDDLEELNRGDCYVGFKT